LTDTSHRPIGPRQISPGGTVVSLRAPTHRRTPDRRCAAS
jgi:hypothetical protein